MWATTYNEFVEAQESILKNNVTFTYTNRQGELIIRQNPACGIAQKSRQQLIYILRQLALSDEEVEENVFENLLN